MENRDKNTIDIFKAIELAGIFIGGNISLRVNSKIKHFDRIMKLFNKYDIYHKIYTPSSEEPERFDIHFGQQTDFQDLYIIVAILGNFGLQSIFPSDRDTNEVVIGSYITVCTNKNNKNISEGITTKAMLGLPFMVTINEFLEKLKDKEYKIKT